MLWKLEFMFFCHNCFAFEVTFLNASIVKIFNDIHCKPIRVNIIVQSKNASHVKLGCGSRSPYPRPHLNMTVSVLSGEQRRVSVDQWCNWSQHLSISVKIKLTINHKSDEENCRTWSLKLPVFKSQLKRAVWKSEFSRIYKRRSKEIRNEF